MIHVVNLSSLALLASYYSTEQAINRVGGDPELDVFEGRRANVKHLLVQAREQQWSTERLRAELSDPREGDERAAYDAEGNVIPPPEPEAEPEAEPEPDGEAVTVEPDLPEYSTEPEGPPDGEHP